MALVCNLPIRFDEQFAKDFPQLNVTKQRVADLRARIEMSTGKKIEEYNDENKRLVSEELRKSRKEVEDAVKAKGNLKTRLLALLKLGVNSNDRNEIISSIASRFSLVTDYIIQDIVEQYPGTDPQRSDITMGLQFTDTSGKEVIKYGEAAILDQVYSDFYGHYTTIFNRRNEIQEEINNGSADLTLKYQVKKYNKAIKLYEQMFKYWPTFVALAREDIKVRESLLSNNDFTYSVEADLTTFFENPEEYDPEANTRESWQQANEERDPFASIGTKVRRILASLPVYETVYRNGKLTSEPKTTALDTEVFMEASSAHKALIELLRGMRDSEDMKNILEKSGAPWVQPILKEIEKDPYFATQLFCDLKRNFQYYSTLTKDFKGKKQGLNVNILNEEKSDIYISRLQTMLLFKPASLYNPGITIFDKKGDIIKERLNEVTGKIIDNFNESNVRNFNRLSVNERAAIIKNILDSLAIPSDYLSILTMVRTGKTANLIQQLKNLAVFGLQDLKNGSRFALAFNSTTEGEKSNVDEYYGKIIKVLNKYNPVVHKLYKVRSKNARGIFADRFSDVTPSHLGEIVEAITRFAEENDKEGLKNFLINNFFKDSSFARIENGEYIIYNAVLRNLWEQANNSRPIDINIKTFEALSSNDVVSENLSAKQHSIAQIYYYFSQFAGSGQVFYPVFILGDSNKLRYITGKKYTNNDDIYKEFYQMFLREVERAKEMEALNKVVTSQGYDKLPWLKDRQNNNRNESFSILQMMNPILKGKKLSEFYISEEDFIREARNIVEGEKGLAQQSFSFFEKLGVFDQQDGKYINLQGTPLKPETIDKDWLNYYLNNKLAMALQLNILDVDTIFAENSKDLQKRNKQNSAPGTSLDVYASWEGTPIFEDGEEKVETIAYFNDIAINTEDTNEAFMKAIAEKFGDKSKVYKEYSKKRGKNAVTLTDGQGYRTLKSYRKVMIMKGSWTKVMENAYIKINNLKNITNPDERNKALEEIYDLATVFQPLKPFTYSHEKIEYATQDGRTVVATIPVQVKYAEAVLIPELLPEGTLKTMAEWMDNHNVDVLASTKCVKMGAFASFSMPDTKGLTAEKAKEDINNILNESLLQADGSFKLGVHKLDYRDYRVQTNVPPHTDMSRSIGTQIRKLIMSDLKHGENHRYDYYFDKTSSYIYKPPRLFDDEYEETINNVDANRLVNIYNSLIVGNILTAFDKFEKEIRNNKKLSKILQNTALNSDRVSIDNLLAFGLTQDEKFLIPLFENQLEHDTMAEVLSIFRKNVNKQQMRGGSAVQVSAMGIQGFDESESLKVVTTADNKNCLYAECEIPFDFSYTDEFGNSHALKYTDYCNEDGTFKKDSDGNILIEKHFPGILDIIAYRVPTERNYSTINLKVVRCSKKIEGGTIKVPAQYTKVAGFDFDIDKLYLLRHDFSVRSRKVLEDNEQSLLHDIWADIYKEYGVLSDLSDLQYDDFVRRHPDLDEDSKLFSKLFGNFKYNHPLYTYWDRAGIPGTKQEAFNEYLERNPDVAEKLEKSIVYSDKVEDIIWDEYDPDITPDRQSNVARNNLLLHIMRERLMDEETFESRYRPGGFDNSKFAARIIRELTLGDARNLQEALDNGQIEDADPEPSYDPTNPETMIIYNQMNQAAGKLIGVFANQNVNHALASLAEEIKLREPIKFDGHLEGYSDLLHNPDGKDTFGIVAEFLAASVDAVKDPVLNYLNFNSLTANSAGLLGRLGYDPLEIGLLFNQPLIKEVCDKAQNDGTSLGTAIKSIKKKYVDTYGDSTDKTFTDADIKKSSSEDLASYIIKGKNLNVMADKNLGEIQFKLLNLFERITEAADELNDFVKATKYTAANSVGSTAGDVYEQIDNVESYVQRLSAKNDKGEEVSYISITLNKDIKAPISRQYGISRTKKGVDVEGYLKRILDNPFAYEQCMFDCLQELPSILNQNFPYETQMYSKIRAAAKKLVVSKKGKLKAATVNSLHKEIPQFILSQFGYWNASEPMHRDNMLYEHSDRDFTIGQYYKYQFGLDYFNFADENDFEHLYPNLYNLIVPVISKEKTYIEDLDETMDVPLVSLNSSSGRGHEIFRQDVRDLVRDEIEQMAKDYPAAAFGLYFYNFFRSGFMFGGNSLSSLFPSSLVYSIPVGKDTVTGKDIYYIDVLKEILTGKRDISMNSYMQQFILNHLDDNSFVYTLNKEATEEFKKITDKHKIKDGFEITYKMIEDCRVFRPVISKEKEGNQTLYTWAPVIAINEKGTLKYYMANLEGRAPNNIFNKSYTTMRYTEVKPLGEAGKYSSYGLNIEDINVERKINTFDDAANINESEIQGRDVDFEVKPDYTMYKDIAVTDSKNALEERNQQLFEEMMADNSPVIDDAGNPIC